MGNSLLSGRQRGVMVGVAVVMGSVFAVAVVRYAHHHGLGSPVELVPLFGAPVVGVLAVYLAVTGRNFFR